MTKTVLLVDDNRGVIRLLKYLLVEQHPKLRIIEAQNGRRCLALFNENIDKDEKIDLVVSDIRMPGLNGIEMVASMKKKHSEVLILLITAFDTSNVIDHARAIGIDNILSKSAGMNEIIKTITELLSL